MVGLTLGMLASFLGIGGGPINVAALCVFMGTELRLSARISVFIILFAQFAGLITKAVTGMVSQVQDFTVLLVMIPAAIIGGLVGSQLNLKLSDEKISYLFRGAVILVIIICSYNIINLI